MPKQMFSDVAVALDFCKRAGRSPKGAPRPDLHRPCRPPPAAPRSDLHGPCRPLPAVPWRPLKRIGPCWSLGGCPKGEGARPKHIVPCSPLGACSPYSAFQTIFPAKRAPAKSNPYRKLSDTDSFLYRLDLDFAVFATSP